MSFLIFHAMYALSPAPLWRLCNQQLLTSSWTALRQRCLLWARNINCIKKASTQCDTGQWEVLRFLPFTYLYWLISITADIHALHAFTTVLVSHVIAIWMQSFSAFSILCWRHQPHAICT